MKKFFFTCGHNHSHIINENAIWNRNSVLQVNAESENIARAKVVSLVGLKWAFCYDEDKIDMSYFPAGICATIEA